MTKSKLSSSLKKSSSKLKVGDRIVIVKSLRDGGNSTEGLHGDYFINDRAIVQEIDKDGDLIVDFDTVSPEYKTERTGYFVSSQEAEYDIVTDSPLWKALK